MLNKPVKTAIKKPQALPAHTQAALTNAIALHQQNLGCQRQQRMALDVANRQRTQVFQAVAVDDDKTRLPGSGGGGGHVGSEHTGGVTQPVIEQRGFCVFVSLSRLGFRAAPPQNLTATDFD